MYICIKIYFKVFVNSISVKLKQISNYHSITKKIKNANVFKTTSNRCGRNHYNNDEWRGTMGKTVRTDAIW